MTNDYTELLTCPFGELATNLSDSELRETAYEILVGACMISDGKLSNYISDSERNSEREASSSAPQTLTSRAKNKVKRALGLRPRRKKAASGNSDTERVKKESAFWETLRVQMRLSEQMDSRVRKALSKVAAEQRIEFMVLPVEMLQQLKPSDFPNQEEYEAWRRRNLKLLEAGLVFHPLLPLDNENNDPQRLREIIDGALETPLETGKNNESMQALRSTVSSLACRTCDNGPVSETSHWADGSPLNLRIYQMLLEACFDVNDEPSVIEELDEYLELIKKTWLVLGMNQMLHNLCFLWILFNHYAATDQAEGDLLDAGNNMLIKVEQDVKEMKEDQDYSKILSSTFSAILSWVEKRLVAYHTYFHSDNTESMACVVSMAVLSAKIMAEGISHEDQIEGNRIDAGHERVDAYIKSSVGAAFVQAWDPRANRERFAQSAIEVLRIVDEAFEAFFLLPITIHAALLPDLATGIDSCLQHYISMTKSGCGNKSTYVPSMPPLTRCSKRSKLPSVIKRKEKIHTGRKSQVGAANGNHNGSFGIPQMCCRINTLYYTKTQLDVLAKREITHLESSEYGHDLANRTRKAFELSVAACEEGIQQLSEATANKIIFQDLSYLFWDGLYFGEVSSSRIKPFLQELDHHLEVISLTVHDKVRTQVITEVMKVSFDGLLLVLLAGGPARAFTLQDYDMIEEDFKFLTDLFWSNGDGLPAELIEKFSTTVKDILLLFHIHTDNLIEKFKHITRESCASSKSKLPLPPMTAQWSPSDPNTVLRVLCYRNDETAAKFLKKTYHLPKKL